VLGDDPFACLLHSNIAIAVALTSLSTFPTPAATDVSLNAGGVKFQEKSTVRSLGEDCLVNETIDRTIGFCMYYKNPICEFQ
jgi:hypothetical protein